MQQPSILTNISDYTILHDSPRIDKGTLGDVYKVPYQQGHLACKYLHEKEGFASELQALHDKQLEHDNILPYTEWSEERGIIVTEWAPLGNLSDLLSKGQLSKSRAVQLALQLAKGLVYLHENKVVARSLHAKNVLLFGTEEEPVAKIADWGVIAYYNKRASSRSVRRDIMVYEPPESLDSINNASGDIYSFGMVLYAMVHLPDPSQGLSYLETTYRLMRGIRPPIPEPADPALEPVNALIRQCWQQNPLDRPTAVQVVQQLSQLAL